MAIDFTPEQDLIKNQLERIFRSAEFKGSEKQRLFMRYIVDETLAGRASRLKGYTIATNVYGRGEGFDAQIDPIVRVEAGRLRRALERYYLTAGKEDPVRIDIPKGGYTPTFLCDSCEPEEALDFSGCPCIAVIPLQNLTGEENQDYFADGLTEELTTELTRCQEFQVIASQSTMRFKGKDVDPAEVSRSLDARFLLMGSVRKDKKTAKVTIRLLDNQPIATQVWGESYTIDLAAADLIKVQEEIARSVIGLTIDQYGLVNRRLSRESRKKAPHNFLAYDAVLRFYHFEMVLTTEAFVKALNALDKAVVLDPDYALAWAMLGHLHADNHALGFQDIEDSLGKAFAFAKKGVALAPENQFVQDALTLVYFHRGDKKQFLHHMEKTIDLNPNASYIVGVAGWHTALFGEWDKGLALLKKSMSLNPFFPSWFHLAPFMYFYQLGEFGSAYSEALKFNYPPLFWDPLIRAASLSQLGFKAEAKVALSELLELEPDFSGQGKLLIGGYVKDKKLVQDVLEGLKKAGLDEG